MNNGLSAFRKAFSNTRREMLLSLLMLFVITLFLSVVFYYVESYTQPDVFDSYWSCIVWAYSRYIEGGDGVFEGGPVTVIGRSIAFLLGVIGIAIVAIPAGLVGSGFNDAMAENKRNKELEEYHKKMLKAFKVIENRDLKKFLAEEIPDSEKTWFNGANFKFISNNINLASLEIKGIFLKDVLDTCEKNPEFRVKNQAKAISIEDGKVDRYVLEHFPINRSYGFFKDRGSKVTIVSTSSGSELGTGNFSYYLAKYAGFNYISKDFDVDADDPESFYHNRWDAPKIDGLTLEQRKAKGEKIDPKLKKLYQEKENLRNQFLRDLESLCQGEGHWVFCVLSQVHDQDIHIAHAAEGGENSLLLDMVKYQELLSTLKSTMSEQLNLSIAETTRYPLVNKGEGKLRNIGYKLREDGCLCNCMTMRVSSHLMHFDTRMRTALFLMAKTIHDVLCPNETIPQDDVADMNRTGYGFSVNEQQVDTTELYQIDDKKGVFKKRKKKK